MKFEGSYVALVTPFDREGRLDEDGYRHLIHRQLKSGTRGLVPCGSTGEAATLLHEEYRRAIEIACDESRGEIAVIAGIGTNATWKAVESAREAESLGADALLVLVPYYNKPTQEGIYQHFRAVAHESRLPIIAYNIPGRTGVNMAPKTLARLAKDCPTICAVKEAAGSLDQVSEILTLVKPGFTVLSGDDSLTVPLSAAAHTAWVSFGAMFATTETTPLAPTDIIGTVRLSSPESTVKPGLTRVSISDT